MRLALLASVALWLAVIGLVYLCFPGISFGESRAVIKIRTYYKPGYQSVSSEWARAINYKASFKMY